MAQNIEDIETKLWTAADELRGNQSAEEYMHIILGIISLKYISDRFKVAKEKLKETGESLRDYTPREFYLTFEAFVVVEEASWDYIMQFANTNEIGVKLDHAFLLLEEKNLDLAGLFNKNYNSEGLDQIKLGNVVKVFSDEDFTKKGGEDLVGRIYEFFLGKFFKDRGQKGGEFYTPESIVKLMVNVLKPMTGKIYDPACGTGGILVQAKHYIEEHGGKITNIFVYGQEYNSVTWKLAKLNLVLNSFPLEDVKHHPVLGTRAADSFAVDQHKGLKFDFAMANPPFNMKKWGQDKLLDDPRWEWGLPPANNANYAWLSMIVSKLNQHGKAAVVLANGSLSSSQSNELEIRKNFVEDNKVDAIIELPDKLFYTTGIPASIWFFNNDKQTDKILMISPNAVKGRMRSKKLRELTDEDIKGIVELFDRHENGEDINKKGIAKSVTQNDLAANDYSFVPGRYVGNIEEKINKKAIKSEIKTLASELNQLLEEFDELVPDVKKAIGQAIAYNDDEE